MATPIAMNGDAHHASDPATFHALLIAAIDGSLDRVLTLLDAGVDPDANEHQDWSPEWKRLVGGRWPLWEAAIHGNADAVELLASRGAKLDGATAKGLTVLHYLCIHHDKPDMARLLLSLGAHPDARDKHRQTPLHRAVWWGCPGVAKVLIEAGADIHALDDMGHEPLDLANGDEPWALLMAQAQASVLGQATPARASPRADRRL